MGEARAGVGLRAMRDGVEMVCGVYWMGKRRELDGGIIAWRVVMVQVGDRCVEAMWTGL